MDGLFSDRTERVLLEQADLEARDALLRIRGLSRPGGDSLVLGIFEGDQIVATGALAGNIIQGVAVDPSMEGSGGASEIVTALLKAADRRGMDHVFVYTKPDEAGKFEALGFTPIAEASTGGQSVALLEWGTAGIAEFGAALARGAADKPSGSGVVVVNCNPFTLGHRHLIEHAAKRSPWLHVLVVQEERSLFPFEVRLDMVRRGCADLSNVSVIPSGPYVVSAATFPTYFLRPASTGEGTKALKTGLYAALDVEVFKRHIAPALRAKRRFIGTEPYCATTSAYNDCMRERLPGEPGAIEVEVLPRLERGGEAVSASAVRALIRRGNLEAVRAIVPEVTWNYLNSERAQPVLERIRQSDSRH